MQRFLPIGSARVQVTSGMMHSVRDAQAVASVLETMRPEAIVVDRSVEEWTRLGAVDPLQKAILDTVPGLSANVLWKAVERAAPGLGAEVVLLHRDIPPPPADGVGDLRRLLAKEGFDPSGEPRRDLAALHTHYIARCPGLWRWLERRRDASAARLRAAFEARPRRATVVLAFPDGDEVCDRVQRLGRE